ncbi:DNA damage-regulated autophagy modulator protein 2 isoform X2 [Onthophagus taurus]|uniref:DNA damage-regulated autophagy modulator protein 2 isoform X2 n=1 Tax=Onthophagus taurus TaxID=166361 RepID=UPI000C202A59|nr:DNA damage-regulated autophagy modulator protein 2 [Onthophagus taurus]
MWNGLNGSKMTITFEKVYWLPIVVFIWFPVTFIITYIIAVITEDVPPIWPYISDTGTFPPEACIFGQLLNTGSILMAMVIYLRYRQVAEISAIKSIETVTNLNLYSLWLGLIASFGISIVGNFQETNVFSLHLIGAGMAFGLGAIYEILQVIVSLRIFPHLGSKQINTIRIFLATLCTICMNLTFIFAAISFLKFNGTDITKWTKEYNGYIEHLCSSINEWITAIGTMGFILTYTNEFKQIKVVEPELQLFKSETHSNEVERY